MTPLRLATIMACMFLGYMAAGPVGGFAGLGLGWWMSRPRVRRKPRQSVPKNDAALMQAYRTLGLGPRAGEDAVLDAYRRLRSIHHPDKLASNGATAAEIKAAQQKAHEVRKAYEVIRDRKRA